MLTKTIQIIIFKQVILKKSEPNNLTELSQTELVQFGFISIPNWFGAVCKNWQKIKSKPAEAHPNFKFLADFLSKIVAQAIWS